MQKKIKNEEAAQQPEVAQRKESKSNKKKAAIQAKSFGGKPLQPIQTKQKGQPPIQAKGFDGKPLQPIPTKQASQSPIQVKQQPIQRKSNPHGLPHQLQSNMENMGGVDLSDVKVHKNSDKPVQLNAHAYAQGSDIHLAPGQDKHLPHEAWHVVQQKQGRVQATTQMKNSNGKVGVNDNPALEREADVMGEKARQGTQGTTKTEQTNGNTSSTVQMKNAVIQRVPKNSHYGTFTDTTYALQSGDTKLRMVLNFKPNANADSTKVGLTQTVKAIKAGKKATIDPNASTKMAPDGHRIDQHSKYRNPLYATGSEPVTNKDKLESYSTSASWGQHGDKDPHTKVWTDAILKDTPTVSTSNNSSTEFETAAIALEGNDKGTYYGSIKWGWKKDGAGKVTKTTFDAVSKGTPSKNFLKAVKAWNDGTTRGTYAAKADNTPLYDGTLKELGKLKKDDTFIQEKAAEAGGIIYTYGKVTSGTQNTKKGYIKSSDLKDKGDGKNTIDLPLVAVKLTKEANVPLYVDADKKNKAMDLPINTRLKVTGEEKGLHKVEIVDGTNTTKTGYLEKNKIKDE
ncbi:eCIS core domain-containing protein [Microscilla marina]|uniref:eCIS core domain-containing protein n=1 Tax=Microscilla marina ATCC 23134 TaxID=313606 RepID=A1ZNE1_MICM2|nr:DUF4157 domain-containing protein [Microscilla marina]EAY28052.1 hypothetical protein M23134_02162 [Microscilla marina ATCC 23134]